MTRVLAFEPYDRGSHRAFRAAVERHSTHDWRWITRPGRAWKWRMRIAALDMVEEAADEGLLEGVEVIFATSLLAPADLKAALQRHGCVRPLVLYMHENQIAYPVETRTVPLRWDVQFALTNLAGVLTADRVVWNSMWNHRSFVEGLPDILRHAPDTPWSRALPATLTRAPDIVWPPVETPPDIQTSDVRNADARDTQVGRRVVWPHRWEHDKGPAELFELAERHTESLGLRWIILGESFRTVPTELDAFRERFAGAIDHWGFAESRTDYWAWLRRADWVLSTARHEFFGIAVVEALLAGCLPWLPERLSYPELLPAGAHGLSPAHPPPDSEGLRASIAAHLAAAHAPASVARLDVIMAEAAARL